LKLRTDSSLRAKHYLDRIERSGKRLKTLYKDEDGVKAAELDEMGGVGPNVYSAFYEKLKAIKENYRKFPRMVPNPDDITQFEPDVEFTGPESWGRYLDLTEFHIQYVNMLRDSKTKAEQEKFVAPDYSFYLSKFSRFDDTMWRKFSPKTYKKYLSGLLQYLVSFIERTQPLYDLKSKRAEIQNELKSKIENENFTQWETDGALAGGEDDPLYCVPCQRRYAKATVFEAHLDGKKHRAALRRQAQNNAPPSDVLALEFEINALGVLMEMIVQDTMTNVERLQSATFEERQREIEDEKAEIEAELAGAAEAEDDEEDDDNHHFGPKTTIDNYPVGWDGKPIPYWLYRLHGLGVEYKCQICGDMSYWGRKNFEMHFQQWRHAHGMACLGIPNTKHFQDVTQIEDAQALWRKMQQQEKVKEWRPDEEEEYEDDEGNVYNRKTFEDLKRQGLIK